MRKKTTNGANGSGILGLPNDVLVRNVAGFLTLAEACLAQRVSRQFKALLGEAVETYFEVFEGSNINMNDVHARALVRRMKALRAVQLRNVSAQIAQDIAVRAGGKLRVFECAADSINDTVVTGIGRACLGLEVLRLAPSTSTKTLAVTDLSISLIARRTACSSFLKEFSIRGAPGVTETGLTLLMVHCPMLTVVEAVNCGVCHAFGNVPQRLLPASATITSDNTNNNESAAESSTIISCPNLRRIDLSSNYELRRECIYSIPNFSKLRSLNLMGAACILDSTLQRLSMECPELEDLCIANCGMVTDQGLEALAIGLAGSTIKRLDVARCSRIADCGLIAIAKLGQLEYLDAQGCFRVSDYCLSYLGKYCHNLTYVNLKGMTSLTDVGIELLCEGCPNLKTVVVASCNSLSDGSLVALAENCHKLEVLDLFCVHQVTDEGLLSLVNGCPLIRSLDLSYCFKVSSGFLTRCRLRKYYWKGLKILKVMGLQEEGDISGVPTNVSTGLSRFVNSNSYAGGGRYLSSSSAAADAMTTTTKQPSRKQTNGGGPTSPTLDPLDDREEYVFGSPGSGGKKRNRRRSSSLMRLESASPNGSSKKMPVPGLDLVVAGSPRAKLLALAREGMSSLSLNDALPPAGHTGEPRSPRSLHAGAPAHTGSPASSRRFGDSDRDMDREKAFAALEG